MVFVNASYPTGILPVYIQKQPYLISYIGWSESLR